MLNRTPSKSPHSYVHAPQAHATFDDLFALLIPAANQHQYDVFAFRNRWIEECKTFENLASAPVVKIPSTSGAYPACFRVAVGAHYLMALAPSYLLVPGQSKTRSSYQDRCDERDRARQERDMALQHVAVLNHHVVAQEGRIRELEEQVEELRSTLRQVLENPVGLPGGATSPRRPFRGHEGARQNTTHPNNNIPNLDDNDETADGNLAPPLLQEEARRDPTLQRNLDEALAQTANAREVDTALEETEQEK